jgi:hypothetical protein
MESNENKTDKYAAYRDENGRWTKGNDVHRCSTEEARRGGQNSSCENRIAKLFKMFSAKPMTAKEAIELDQWLLTRNEEELQAVADDVKQPIVVRTRAQALLDKKIKFDATERLYDRAFGKPTLRQEIQTNEAPPVLVRVIDGGKDNNIENNGE